MSKLFTVVPSVTTLELPQTTVDLAIIELLERNGQPTVGEVTVIFTDIGATVTIDKTAGAPAKEDIKEVIREKQKPKAVNRPKIAPSAKVEEPKVEESAFPPFAIDETPAVVEAPPEPEARPEAKAKPLGSLFGKKRK